MLLAASSFAAACGRKKGTGYAGYALVATAGDNSVSAIDLTAFRLVKTIQLQCLAVRGSGRRKRGRVRSNPLKRHSFTHRQEPEQGSQPPAFRRFDGIPLNSRWKTAGRDCGELRELIEADPATLNVLRRQKLRDRPTGLDVSNTGYVAVSSSEAGSVELFRLGDGQRSRAQLNGPIGALRFRQDGNLLLVAKTQDHSLALLNIPDLQVIADLPLAMKPENLCFTPDGGQLFVSGEGMDAVAIVFPIRRWRWNRPFSPAAIPA